MLAVFGALALVLAEIAMYRVIAWDVHRCNLIVQRKIMIVRR
jgi:hypothetical protein